MGVKGIELFREQFSDVRNHYALIGGSACDLLFSHQGLRFRATKDLDIVVIADKPMKPFAGALWSFVAKGGYSCGHRSDGTVHYYRFTKPAHEEFPHMIELFARHPNFLLHNERSPIIPLPVDEDVSSLSAILLDDDYYDFLVQGLTDVEGVSVVDALHLIPLKARAHLDLIKRHRLGDHVDSSDLKKHRKDVLRLIELIPIGASIDLPERIKSDMATFVQNALEDRVLLERLKLGIPLEEALAVIEDVYKL